MTTLPTYLNRVEPRREVTWLTLRCGTCPTGHMFHCDFGDGTLQHYCPNCGAREDLPEKFPRIEWDCI